jgi:hypothetical protein
MDSKVKWTDGLGLILLDLIFDLSFGLIVMD